MSAGLSFPNSTGPPLPIEAVLSPLSKEINLPLHEEPMMGSPEVIIFLKDADHPENSVLFCFIFSRPIIRLKTLLDIGR